MTSKKLDIQTLELLAKLSEKKVDDQMNALDSLRQKTATITTIATIGFTLLASFSGAGNLTEWQIALIIVGCLLLPLIFFNLFRILKSVDLKIGHPLDKYEKSVLLTHQEALLEQIGSNKSAFIGNQILLDKKYRNFKNALIFIAIAGTYFIVFLMIKTYITSSKEQDKVTNNYYNMYYTDPKDDNAEEQNEQIIPNIDYDSLDEISKAEESE